MFAGDWTPNLKGLFEDREAIFDHASDTRVSYAELALRVDKMAKVLVHIGVRRGDRVAILAKNRLEHFDLLFATARLGAIFVPLNWRLALPELEFLLGDAEPSAVFVDAGFASIGADLVDRFPPGLPIRLVGLDSPPTTPSNPPAGIDGFATLMQSSCKIPSPEQEPIDLEDPWIILYTSGTTGRPKGALLPHRQVCFNALNTMTALGLTADDRTITYTPLFHTGALHVLSTPLLMVGGSFVLTDGFDPEVCLDLCQHERCTLLFGVPTTFEMMSSSPRFGSTDLRSVRGALCGGAPCPISLIETWAARGVLFKQGYGLTEVGPNCLNLREADVARKLGSAGRPNLHIVAKILDDDGEILIGAGRGELALGGPCVCAGYWRRPEATAASLTPEGLFKTGDLVERDDEGFISIVDRKKDMFISGGENVYPAEVERALAAYPGVRGCAVVGVKDAQWGEVGRAFVEAPGTLLVDDVRRFLKARLATYKIPKSVVTVRALPRNASGKVQKHLLAHSGATPALSTADELFSPPDYEPDQECRP